MDKTVIIYESKYGSTRRYAEWLSKALSCPIFENQSFSAKNFAEYENIIYGGGLYAGGVSGIRLLTKNWNLLSGKKVILFTCGLSDPSEPANVSHIREALSLALPDEMMKSMVLFHLRGGINYAKLSIVHKFMMSMLRRMLQKKDPSELTSEDKQLLETYGKEIDFTDRTTLQPIIDYISS